MVRVLQVLGRSAGGIARHVSQVTAALDADGFDIEIAGPRDLPIAMPKDVIDLDIPSGLFGHRRAVSALNRIVKAGAYDVVHAHGIRAGIDAGRACRHLNASVVTTIHNLIHPEVSGRIKAAAYKPAERIAVRVSDRVLAVSRDIADALLQASGHATEMSSKVEVLYLGIGDPPPVTRSAAEIRSELDATGPLIVSAARLSAQKALHVLIEALAQMTPDVTAVVVGQGPLEDELRAQAERAGVNDRVHFPGWTNDAASYIAAGDVFVLSSVWEGIPLAAQEAILLGTTVVATNVGGMSELISDGVSGRLVPSGDATSLAGALEQVLEDENLARTYAERARDDLSRTFSTEAMLARLKDIYAGASRAS